VGGSVELGKLLLVLVSIVIRGSMSYSRTHDSGSHATTSGVNGLRMWSVMLQGRWSLGSTRGGEKIESVSGTLTGP
jgi:hypothetical protein